MANFKQAAVHWCVPNLTDEQAKQLYEIGITGIEMPPPEDYSKWIDRGFTIATIGGHQTLRNGLNKRENHTRIADELRANLEVAQKLGIPNLICFSGDREGKSDEEGAANTIEGLRLVAKDAEDAGVNLVMELLNSKDHTDYQCDHTAWGVEVVKAVNSPRVKLLYDVYHMQRMEGDIVNTIRENADFIAHYHTAGNPGRKDLDDQQEIHYPAVARAIYETGYDGWIGHEFSPKSDAVAALHQALQVCKI